MARPPPFPFDPLPVGEVTPHPGPGDMQENLLRDVRIVRWFIEAWARRFKPGSTLGQFLALSEQVDLKSLGKTVDELDREVARHALHLSATLVRLAWAVRALHGRDGALDNIDGSFIDDEVMGEDSKQRDAERRLPGGVATLVFAARLVQGGGGRILSINGKGVPGHDIRWRTQFGDLVLVERKDRSYEAGLGDTAERRIKKVIAEVRNAADTMPREPGAARVLVVGFQHLVRESEAEAVDKGYDAALKEAFGGGEVPLGVLPHVVIIEHLGLEPKTSGEKWNFFSPQPLNPEPTFMARVAPLLVKALGVKL